MKIEDELRSALRERANTVAPDDEAAWVSFERRGDRAKPSRRIVAGAVAIAVAIAAFALVERAFAPAPAVQPSSPPSYDSVDQIVGLLRTGGAGCTDRGGTMGPSMGVEDSGTCVVDGRRITINVYGSQGSMQRYAQPPTTPKGWTGVYWVRGVDWFIETRGTDVATRIQSLLGGEILGGSGTYPSASAAPSETPTNPLDRPKLNSVRVVPERVVGSSPHGLIVEAPIGQVRWRQNHCEVSGSPVGGGDEGSFGGGCDGGALSANVGGLRVDGVFYDVISGHAYYGQEVSIRVTFVDGSSTEVTTADGMWLVVFRPQPESYSPASKVATVEAVSSAGQMLDRVKVP
ncbi:MAG TPA: hypothetical protein VJ736_02885 [Actinomycetota bacterium]|nr:hypothetical protein [Actinomycetota bacterium]